MPIYMDRHYVEGATRHAIANAHEKDLATQERLAAVSPLIRPFARSCSPT